MPSVSLLVSNIYHSEGNYTWQSEIRHCSQWLISVGHCCNNRVTVASFHRQLNAYLVNNQAYLAR